MFSQMLLLGQPVGPCFFLQGLLFLRVISGDFNFCDLSFSREASGLVLLSSCPQTASRLRSSLLTHREPGDPQPRTGEKGWEAPETGREVPASNSVASSCLFLSAVTDGIPVTSEGKIQAALKLEHIDGVNLVSQGLGGEEGTLRHTSRRVKGIDMGVAGPSFPLKQVSDHCLYCGPCPGSGGNR